MDPKLTDGLPAKGTGWGCLLSALLWIAAVTAIVLAAVLSGGAR